MKKLIIINLLLVWGLLSFAQGIYNDGAHIVSTTGSYWVVDNGSFTLTSNSSTNPTQFDNLVITNDASLTLGSASTPTYLTVSDGFSMTSPATVTIPSGSTGSSSLIVGTISGTGSFTVNRYITGASLDWHLISSPVTSQEISGDFTPGGSTYDFYLYNEPSNEWINRKNTSVTPTDDPPYFDDVNGDLLFTPGRGYLAAYNESNPTKSFVGSVNQGTVSQSLTIDGSTQYQGANLLGNPYPSSIDWKAPSGWTRTMLRDDDENAGIGYSMYIWNETAGNYGTFISNGSDGSGTNSVTRYIPPMQGFFVMAASAGSFKMTEDVCVHESVSSWLKNTNVNPNIIRLKVNSSGYGSDEVVIEDSKTSTGGAQKWFTFVETAPSLWIDSDDKQYSILLNNVDKNENHYPIGFKAGIEEQYSITALFDPDSYMDIILEDKKLGNFHNLLESPNYNFYGSPTDNPDRFVLHFSGINGIDNDIYNLNTIRTYASGNTLYILNPLQKQGTVTIYTTTGQKTVTFKLNGDTKQQNTINTNNIINIVKINTNDEVISNKVIFR